MHMDLPRSTTSRHAVMVKRAFNRARDPQRMWMLKKFFSKCFFWRKIQMIIFEQNHPPFFLFEVFPLSKKKRKLKKKYFLGRDFLNEFFLLENFKKMKTPEKQNRKSRKNEKHNKRKRISRQLKTRKQFLQTNEKSRGDKRSFFFLKNTIFSMAIFEKNNFQMKKKHKKEIIKKNFFWKKLERLNFSEHEEISTQWDLNKIVFCCKSNFRGQYCFSRWKKGKRNFPRSSKNQRFLWKSDFKNK